MQYRKFGKIDFAPSALGFGCMRFPMQGWQIDEPEAIKMLHHGIDCGVNYLDTAYGYHDGHSEELLGKALKGGYKEKVKIATKLPLWLVKSRADFDKLMSQQMKRLQTDHIDFYLLHALNKQRWDDVVLKFGILEELEKAQKEGKISHIGFSFHDSQSAFFEIVDAYDKWEFCQIQLNYIDHDYQAGMKGLKYAAEKGLGVIVMEPLRGGRISNPPERVDKILKDFDSNLSPVQIALDWLWSMDEVSFLLSGMSTFDQVKANIRFAEESKIGKLQPAHHELIEKVKEAYSQIPTVPCTKCGYCMPCPSGVNIPRCIELLNDYITYSSYDSTKRIYEILRMETKGKATADKCIGCKACEANCPQSIEISSTMNRVTETFK